MKREIPTVLAMALLALSATGCTTLAKESIGKVRGAKGVYAQLSTSGAASLSAYTRFELGQMKDDFGGRTPPELTQLLGQFFQEELIERELADLPAGKTLVVRGTILHYEDSRLAGMVTGPIEQVLVRAELVDKEDGTVLATANCIGRTTTRVNKGVPHKARGLAKALVGWIHDARTE